MSPKLHNFETKFIQFCDLFKHCDKTNAVQVRTLQAEFEKLHLTALNFTNTDLEHLSANHLLLKEFFNLGKEHFKEFCKQAVSLIDSNQQQTAMRLAHYIKSQEAFESIRSKREIDTVTRQKLQDLLGGILGVEIGQDFVASVKMENLGRIIGYALSGLCKGDLDTYWSQKQLSSKIFKYRNQTVEDFLSERIIEQDLEFVYHIGDSQNGQKQVAGLINGHRSVVEYLRFGQTRAQNRPDSFFVNHDEKKIVVVAATSNYNGPGEQAIPLVKAHQCVRLLTQQEFINDIPNDVYGYKIEMCFCHAGFAPSEQSKTGKQTGSAFFEAAGHLTIQQRNTLMRSAFLSLLGENGVSHLLQHALRETNVHILGTDSEDLYHKMRFAANLDERSPWSREMAKVCLTEISNVLDILTHSDFNLSFQSGSKTLSEAVLQSVVGAAKNYFKVFPLVQYQELPDDERNMLLNIGQQMGVLKQKLFNSPDTYNEHISDCLSDIKRCASDYSERNLNEVAEEVSVEISMVTPTYIFSEQKHSEMEMQQKEQTADDHKRIILSNYLMEQMTSGTLAPSIQEFINLARVNAEDYPVPNMERAREFFTDIEHIFAGKKNLDALSSQMHLKNPRDSFKRWINTVAIHSFESPSIGAEAIVLLSELFNAKWLTQRENIPSNMRMKESFNRLAETMVSYSKHSEYLNDLLKDVYRAPKKRTRNASIVA